MHTTVQVQFVRGVIEAIADASASPVAQLRARLGERLSLVLSTVVSSTIAGESSLPLPDAEALLIELDTLSGLPPGQALERAGRAFALRTGSRGASGSDAGDESRLRSAGARIEAVFSRGVLSTLVETSEDRVSLTMLVGGRPRTARLLRHFVDGMVRAMLVAPVGGAQPRVSSSTADDRAVVSLSYERETPIMAVPRSRRPSSVTLRTALPLADQVDAILRNSPVPPPTRRGPREDG